MSTPQEFIQQLDLEIQRVQDAIQRADEDISLSDLIDYENEDREDKDVIAIHYTTTSTCEYSISSSSSSSSSFSSSINLSPEEQKAAAEKISLNLSFQNLLLGYSLVDKDLLKKNGMFLQGIDLARARASRGIKLSEADQGLLWQHDQIMVDSTVDLNIGGEPMDYQKAINLLSEAAVEVHGRTSAYTPTMTATRAPPQNYDDSTTTSSSSTSSSSEESLSADAIAADQAASAGQKSFRKLQDALALLSPEQSAQVKRALALRANEKMLESRSEEEALIANQQALLHAETQREENLKRVDTLRREYEQTHQEGDLFTSQAGLQVTGQETEESNLYENLHPGEEKTYLGDAKISAAVFQTTASKIKDTHKLTTEGGDTISTVKALRLSGDDLSALSVHTDGGKLVDGKGLDLDTAGRENDLSFFQTPEAGKALWVELPDGTVRVGSGDELTEGRTEFHAAQAKLREARLEELQEEARKNPREGETPEELEARISQILVPEGVLPRSTEEALQFGFPEDVKITHHSTLADGGRVRSGGELVAEDGHIKTLSTSSGHYRPDTESAMRVVEKLDEDGAMSRAVDSTVSIFEDNRSETLTTSSVLASGDDLGRARKLEAALKAEKNHLVNTRDLTDEQRALLQEHQARIAVPQQEAHQIHSKEIPTLRAERNHLLRLPPDETSDTTLRQLGELEESIRGARDRINTLIAQSDAALQAMVSALAGAGVAPETVEELRHYQNRGVTDVSEAIIDMVTWMSSLADRRHEIKALQQAGNVKKQRQDLEALLKGRPQTPPDIVEDSIRQSEPDTEKGEV